MEQQNREQNEIRGETIKQQEQVDLNLRNSLMGYEGQSLEQQLPEPPQTFVLECNKLNAQEDGDSYEVDPETGIITGRPNSWTNNFPPIKLKKGDQVSVNSAFLSSRGGGDLLQFDPTNNKTRILFEYYSINDKTNGKRNQIDIKGSTYDDGDPYAKLWYVEKTAANPFSYKGEQYNYPANYRPMPLYRLMMTYKDATDFPTLPPIDTVRQTDNTAAIGTPYYSSIPEANWGYQTGGGYILDALEDNYVPGLIRAPKLKVNETMFYQDTSEGNKPIPDPGSYNPTFGANAPDIAIWYVATRASKLGPCSEEATMRIYFPFGSGVTHDPAGGTIFNRAAKNNIDVLKRLRPSDTIQFGNVEAGVGLYSGRAALAGSQDGATAEYTKIQYSYGSNCYFCSGYAQYGEGIIATKGPLLGDSVDKFTQGGTSGAGDPAFMNIMGMMMKIVRVNIGAYDINTGIDGNRATGYEYPLPSAPGTYYEWIGSVPGADNDLPQINADLDKYGTWIEVLAPRAVSFAYGDPNNQSLTQMPCFSSINQVRMVDSVPVWDEVNRWGAEEEFNPRRDGYQLGIFTSFAVFNLRTWETLQRQSMTLQYEFQPTGTKPVGMPNDSYLNTCDAHIFPYDVLNDVTPEKKYYYNYVPFFRAQTDDPTWEQNPPTWGHTGPWSSQRELRGIPPTVEAYQNLLGLGTGAVGLHAPNYNYTVNSPSPDIDSNTLFHYGWEMMAAVDGYSGARMPQEYIGTEQDSYSTNTYSTCQKTASFNSGVNIWGWVDQTETATSDDFTNTALSAVTASTPASRGIWGDPSINTMINHTSAAHLGLKGGLALESNKSKDFVIKNSNNKDIKYYFSFSITESGGDYSGATPYYSGCAPAGQSPTTTPGTKPDAATITGDADMTNGSKNFIKTIINLPQAKYDEAANGAGFGVTQNINGLTYGTLIADPAHAHDLNRYIQGGDKSSLCLCNVMSQMPTLFYARFYNPDTKLSEIMYCQVLNYYIHTNSTANSTTWEGDDKTVGENNAGLRQCPFLFEAAIGGENPGTYHSLPQLLILQRNVTGTAKHYFNSIATDGNLYAAGSTGSYFTILNYWANTSHEISVDNIGRELLVFGESDIAQNKQYQFSVVNQGQRMGLETGGDFYINSMPNLPSNINSVAHFTGSRLRLSTESVQLDDPGVHKTTDTSPESTNAVGKRTWNIHYDYIDLELDAEKSYYSPSDVGSLITEQLHAPADLYKSYIPSTDRGGGRYEGGSFPNTKGKYPTNSLFRPIHGPSSYSTDPAQELLAPNNTEDSTTGDLKGIYHDGDFCFFSDISTGQIQASINAYAWCEGKGCLGGDNSLAELPTSGQYIVWLRNNLTKMNIYPMTDFYNIKGYSGAAVNARAQNVLYEAPYDWQSKPIATATYGDYENRYFLESSFMSQFIGTNNATLIFNESVSKFEWQYFHQPVYSAYKEISPGSGTFEGGDIIARIWAQNMDGVSNHDRHGGINVVNWTSPALTFGDNINRRTQAYIDPLVSKDTIGVNFMNKLGFNQYWQKSHSGRVAGGYKDTGAFEDYFPLGTTQSDYDIAQAKPYTQKANTYTIRNPKARKILEEWQNYQPNGDPQTPLSHRDPSSQNDFSENTTNSLMGMTATSYGYTKTGKPAPGTPGSWYDDPNKSASSSDAQDSYLENDASLQSYSFINTFQTPFSVSGKYLGMKTPPTDVPSQYSVAMDNINLDDVKHPFMEIEVSSSPMRAPELPKKTTIGYFFIMSDLIDKHEFLGSINDGSPLKCLGLLSKNYENNDFFFSFQSPVQFYVKQDRTVTSIKTEILTPSLTDPIGLDFNSSVIYTIIRENSVPEPDVAPVALQQAYDYDIMEQLAGQLGITGGNPQALLNSAGVGEGEAQMGGGGFAGLRKEIVTNALTPGQNSPLQLEMSITSNIQRMNVAQRQKLLTTFRDHINKNIGTGVGAVGVPVGEYEPFVTTGPIAEQVAAAIGPEGINWDAMGQTTGEIKKDITTPDTHESYKGEFNRLGDQIPRKKWDTPTHDGSEQSNLKDKKKRRGSQSTRELLAEQQSIADKARQPFHQVGLTEFYQAYRDKNMSGASKKQWGEAIKKGGVQVEKPDTWHVTTLRHWQGVNKDFNWGKEAHTRMDNKQLNHEGREKINHAFKSIGDRFKATGKINKAHLKGLVSKDQQNKKTAMEQGPKIKIGKLDGGEEIRKSRGNKKTLVIRKQAPSADKGKAD